MIDEENFVLEINSCSFMNFLKINLSCSNLSLFNESSLILKYLSLYGTLITLTFLVSPELKNFVKLSFEFELFELKFSLKAFRIFNFKNESKFIIEYDDNVTNPNDIVKKNSKTGLELGFICRK